MPEIGHRLHIQHFAQQAAVSLGDEISMVRGDLRRVGNATAPGKARSSARRLTM